MIELDTVHHSDIFGLCAKIDDASVDMILCDLPYGTTRNKWDAVIPFIPMWAEFARIAKPTAVIALTASQPFTSALVMSNPKMFRHEWIWLKNRGSNFLNLKREPMKEHESVVVFSAGKWTYNPQLQERSGGGKDLVGKTVSHGGLADSNNYGDYEGFKRVLPEMRKPSSWQKFNAEVGLHPTQKPVSLFEYLIKTYTLEGETVFDPCVGSGTTAIAAQNTGRRFIVGDSNKGYVEITNRRLNEPTVQPKPIKPKKRKVNAPLPGQLPLFADGW
jgi:site-specific DNA-methyltransferase (adenine-specific)